LENAYLYVFVHTRDSIIQYMSKIWCVTLFSCSPHPGEQLRERIIIWHFQEQKTVAEIACLAGCTECNIYQILKLHWDFGHMRNTFAQCHGQPRILNQQDLTFVLSVDGIIALDILKVLWITKKLLSFSANKKLSVTPHLQAYISYSDAFSYTAKPVIGKPSTARKG